MLFEFAIPSKNVLTVNREGTVAICTLWTPPDYVRRELSDVGINMSPSTSSIAVIGGLYGTGLKIMLRNLLYNPQIDTVLLFGKDHSGAGNQLVRFFQGRIGRTGKMQEYIFEDGEIRELEIVTINGDDSKYSMDELVLPELFKYPPAIVDLGNVSDENKRRIQTFFMQYKPCSTQSQRINVPLPKPIVDVYPSCTHGQMIVTETILGAWQELLFRLSRFGIPTTFRSGKRRNELLDVKVVIGNPAHYSSAQLERFNIPTKEIVIYQESLLNAELGGDGESYTYGNRLRKYFGADLLESVINDLCRDKDARRCYITLWGNKEDIEGKSSPCLVSLYFRKTGAKVNLTAVFRSHNGARAWPRNCFGLLGIMNYVCGKINQHPDKTEEDKLCPGVLTVLSHSISLDPAGIDEVKGFIDDYAMQNQKINLDPNGFLRIAISPETKELVVQHYGHDHELLGEYRSTKPEQLRSTLSKLCVLSDLSHAMYIGSQLERAYICLVHGIEYTQDKTTIHLK